MPFNSAGVYSLPPGSLGVTGQTILAQTHNRPVQDIEQALSAPYLRDGRAPMTANIPMNGYQAKGAKDATDPQDYVTLAQMQAAISPSPVGTLLVYTVSSTIIPTGYLAANGQSVLREAYPALWAALMLTGANISATQDAKTNGQYGPGDGSTTFTMPNLYADDGYFIRPLATGRTIGSLQADELRSHTHSGTAVSAGAHSHSYGTFEQASQTTGPGNFFNLLQGTNRQTDVAGAHTHTLAINSTGGAETRPKNIAYPVLIKAL